MKKIIDFFKRLIMLLSGKRLDRNEDNKPILMSGKCPQCNNSLNYINNGLVEIEYDYTAGGPIGAGIHISGHGKQEYQFHYDKCSNCGYWKMIEYRETPSWWDDLWNNDCPFTQGDIIQKFKNGEVYRKKYTGHTITR